jgi:hypothetical protein
MKAQLNPEELALELGRELLEEANGKSRHDVASRIVELMDNRVLPAVSMRALHDAQSARLYFERSDRIREESITARARLEEARFREWVGIPLAKGPRGVGWDPHQLAL